MPDEQVRIDITATDDASKVLDKVADKVDELEHTEVEVPVAADTSEAQRDIGDLLDKVDRLAADPAKLLLSSNAADIGSDILDLLKKLDKLDATDPQVSVTVDQINQLQGDLDQVETRLKDLSGTKVDIDTGPARDGVKQIGTEGDKSKSVLANMVGNSTQDLAALGGIAGSAGVALGQLGEYATEGDIALSGLAQTIVPMAALGFAVQALTKHMADLAATKAFNTERVGKFADALDDAKVSADELVGILSKDQDLGIFERWRNETVNVDKDVSKFFKSFQDFKRLTDQGMPGFDKWAKQQLDAAKAGGANTIELLHLKEALADVRDGTVTGTSATNAMAEGNESLLKTALAITSVITGQGEATKNAGFDTKFYGDAAHKAAKQTDEATDASIRSGQASADAGDALADWANAWADAIEGAQTFTDTLKSVDFRQAEFKGAADGMAKFEDQFFGIARIAADTEEAYDSLGKSLHDNGRTFDLTTERGRANQKALEGVARTINTKMIAAYDDADGNQQTFNKHALIIARDTLDRLQKQFGLSADQAHDLAKRLGLLPDDITTRYKLAGTEEARGKIALLQTAIDKLPEDVQTKVTQRIIVGDYQGALNIVQGYYTQHPAGVKVNATKGDTQTAWDQTWQWYQQHPVTVPVQGSWTGEVPGVPMPSSSAAAASVVNVTQHVPRGYRGDLLEDARKAARRSGGLYHRNRR